MGPRSEASRDVRRNRARKALHATRRTAPKTALAAATLLLVAASRREANAASALATVSRTVADELGAVPENALVVTSPLVSDQPAPRADELALRLARLLAGQIAKGARAHPRVTPADAVRGTVRREPSYVHVQPEIVRGDLRVTVDVYRVPDNVWVRVRSGAPAPLAHAFARAPIDAELRAFLPSIPLEQATLRRAPHDETDVLAAACGDVDGDGGLEIALVSRARVALGKLQAGKFVVTRAAPWRDLAPRAPVPLREPLGSAVIAPLGGASALFVGTTDRAGIVLDSALRPREKLDAIPLPWLSGAVCARALPEASALAGPPIACGSTALARTPLLAATPSRFDALSAFELVARDGTTRPVVAMREPGAALRVRVGTREEIAPNVGAHVALADLDQDGTLDVASNADGDDDVLTVASGLGDERRVRAAYPAPEGVRALAVCPPEHRGAPALVAVVGREVWLVR
jgi:hypothetical protein